MLQAACRPSTNHACEFGSMMEVSVIGSLIHLLLRISYHSD